MKLSVKSDYAARAVLSLARRFDQPEPTRLEEIAAENHLPPGYLVQILLELKAHRIVRSSRGKDGGYRLSRPPAEISLGDILRCVHGNLFDTPALTNPQCPPELRESWGRLQFEVEQAANRIHFQQILDTGADRARMFYI
jgi:Rrf2 family protein